MDLAAVRVGTRTTGEEGGLDREDDDGEDEGGAEESKHRRTPGRALRGSHLARHSRMECSAIRRLFLSCY